MGSCGATRLNGKGIDKWIKRMAEHDNGIALLPARPDTAWFYDMSQTACLVKFVRGRIRFHPGDKHAPNTGSPGAGNVLAAWGAYAATVLSESDIKRRFATFVCMGHRKPSERVLPHCSPRDSTQCDTGISPTLLRRDRHEER